MPCFKRLIIPLQSKIEPKKSSCETELESHYSYMLIKVVMLSLENIISILLCVNLSDFNKKMKAIIWTDFFSSFWDIKNSGFFSPLTASVVSKTCSFLNLRKGCPLTNSYMFHMILVIERWALQKQFYWINIFSQCPQFFLNMVVFI